MPSRGAVPSQGETPFTLTSARESFAPGHIEQIQRARVVGAMVQVVDAQGVANATVANVVTRAGVSRRTFYELFSDCHECLLAALQDAAEHASARVLPAYEAERGDWRTRIRAGLVALLAFFDEQPAVARLLLVEWLAAGPRALERRQQLFAQLASAVDEGRDALPGGGATVPELTAEGVVGAVASLLHARLLRPRAGARLLAMANQLMAVIVLPYLGLAAARREIAQTPPATSAKQAKRPAPEDLLGDLKMRLTYRTMRVLAAVAANPGGSNRVIARAAGIGDQGQISKLLMRLRNLGLVENRGLPVKGEANAWILTAQGAQIERLLGS